MADHTHPITPPPELVQQWYTEADNQLGPYYDYIATQAARWGADTELEANCEWLEKGPYGFSITASAPHITSDLRAARRSKPPSLAEQALDAAEDMSDCMNDGFVPNRSSLDTIRRALVRLKELEQQENNDN